MLRHFNFLRYNIDEKINNFSLSIQPQRVRYLEMSQHRSCFLNDIINCVPLNVYYFN